MRAIIVSEFGDPGVLRVDEVADPTPGAGEVLVQVRAAGVNPVDTYLRSGEYARLPSLPYTPGSDAAGEVVEVGPGVDRWIPGDRVYTDHRASGSYAELLCCPAEFLHPLPDGVGFAAGATLGVPATTAYRALFAVGGGRAGERLLIHGATGGVGLAAVQLAVAAGMEVTASGGSVEGRDLLESLGVTRAVDHRAISHAARLEEAAGEHGFDLILEMAAHVNLALDLRVVAKRGSVVIIGSRGGVEIDPRDVMSREAEIRGMTLFQTPAAQLEEIHQRLGAAIERGELRPVVAAELPLAAAAEAHEQILASPHTGNLVLVP